MRTVYLVNVSFDVAGTERRFANIWRTLRARGNVRPVMVVPDTLLSGLLDAGLVERAADPDIMAVKERSLVRMALTRVPALRASRFAGPIRTRAIVQRFHRLWREVASSPDAVMHIGLPCGPLVPPNVPLVIECVDSTFGDLGRKHFRRAATLPCVVNCQTDRIRTALESAVGEQRKAWKTVTSPCYFAQYDAEASRDAGARDSSLVVFIGRLSSEKSPMLFVDAIAQARKRGVAVRGLMLGRGPMQAEVLARIQELGLESCLSVEFVAHPTTRLAQAAVVTSLQSGDNYGSQALLEAMGAGCAVIASDVGETWRLVDQSVGIRIPLDATALADAIEALVSDPKRTAALGAAASHLSRTRHSADAYVSFLESLYQEASEMHSAARRTLC